MTFGRIWALASSAGLLALLGGCGAKIQSLGENTGGAFALSTGGSGNAQDFGGSGAGGPTGGRGDSGAGETGGNSPGPATGGVGPGSGGSQTGGSAAVSYPWAPTVPLDPQCTCATTAQVCNAAGQCVPRCDQADRCAVWLAEHAVKDLYLEGSTLYYLTAPSQDPLANPLHDGALWRVVTGTDAPQKIAGGLGTVTRIMGRAQGATYINADDGDVEVSDAGAVRALDQGSGIQGCILGAGALYCLDSGALVRLGLDAAATPEPVLASANWCWGGLMADTKVWCLHDGDQLSVIEPATLAVSTAPLSSIAAPFYLLAIRGSQAFVHTMENVASFDQSGAQSLVLYRPANFDIDVPFDGRLFGGWLYVTTYSYSSSAGVGAYLQRFPTAVGRLAQDVLPPELAMAATYRCTLSGCGTENLPIFAVGDAGLFWAQRLLRSDGQGLNGPQYIFHAPLPPQPCDAELPCEHTGEVCGNSGFCEPASNP